MWRRIVFILVLVQALSNASAQEWINCGSAIPQKVSCALINDSSTVIKIDLQGFYRKEVFPFEKQYIITAGDASPILQAGYPDLPKSVVSIIIPETGSTEISIEAFQFVDFNNYDIAPSAGEQLRNEPYLSSGEKADIYKEDAFWPEQLYSLPDPYILRNFRGQAIYIYPFRYNPVSKVLRVYTSVTLQVAHTDDKSIEIGQLKKAATNEFNEIYKNHFLNYSSFYNPVSDEGELLILCPQQWLSLMQPLVEWKTQKGIKTSLVDAALISNDAAAIKNYIAGFYQQHNLSHVLLVGDDSFMATPFPQGIGGPSDPSYGYLSGNDSYPEVFIGRFPAENATEVETMVQRVLDYEKTPDTSLNWFDNAICIGSNLGPGDDNEMDWEHEANIRSQLIGFTYSQVAELYDGTHSGTTDAAGDPVNTDVTSLIQSGVSLLNYTGHGTNNSFSTTGFSNADVYQLTNTSHLPVIWSVGCTNGNFTGLSTCMGEALLRATNNNLPVGAAATLMSSINQFWNAPMDAQDEMNAILVESYANNIKRTFGGISYNGCMHMNDNYGSAGALMTDTWHCFGDPSLEVRTAMPQQLTVNHPLTILVGDTSIIVNCNAQGALVSLVQSGSIIATGIINAGAVTITFNPVTSTDSIIITITGFNLYPYSGLIHVDPTPGAYVIYKDQLHHDPTGNNNGLVDFNETIVTDITIQNAGLSASGPLTYQVVSTDSYITLLSGSGIVSSVDSLSTFIIPSAMQFIVGDVVPDQHAAEFILTITDSTGQTWSSTFYILINAPSLSVGNVVVNDSGAGNGDGIAQPGETIDLAVEYINSGHADAPAVIASILSNSSYLILLNDTINAGTIAANTSVWISYPSQINSNTPLSSIIDAYPSASSGNYVATDSFSITAGYYMDDFETGGLNQFNWIASGNVPWFVTTDQPYAGTYCVQSGEIDNNEISSLSILLDVTVDDSMAFYYKISCEPTWDFMQLKVDSVQRFLTSGNVAWTYKSIFLPAGLRRIEFTYEKDNVFSAGSDAVWLDDVRFPAASNIVSVEEKKVQKFLLFPNPADQFVNITGMLNEKVYITDMAGRAVYSGVNKTGMISIGKLPDGIYNLTLGEGGRQIAMKLIVYHNEQR